MKMEFKLFNNMSRPMKIMLISVAILFGSIFLYKSVINIFMKMGFSANKDPVMTVSTAKAAYADWQPEFKSVGSTRAILGVNITAQLGGMIQKIYFSPGAVVNEGDVLVQQNADPNIASLHSLEANAELAKITYDRDSAQYRVKGISKQQLDADLQNLKSFQAQVAQQAAIVAQLTIKAPFAGRLGISRVNPGQYLSPGDAVVTIQQLNPLYVDFYLPQQALPQLSLGQTVNMTIDSFPGEVFSGKITTINPIVETNTRNVEIEATIENPRNLLVPGMFSNVRVLTDTTQRFLTVPQTAISFNPYGSIVYLVNESTDNKRPGLIARQTFVTTGDARGDQVTVLSGLKENDTVITSGQLKLKNGSRIAINNTVVPNNNADPTVSDEHKG